MNIVVKRNAIALSTGTIFGIGLGLSQMIDRQRVLGFLDIAGNWDPTLLFVLAGAVAFTVIAFRFVLQRSVPLFSKEFFVPKNNTVDRNLVLGAAIFGMGWGISGYCPGPGITALVTGSWDPVVFVLSLVIGMFLFERLRAKENKA